MTVTGATKHTAGEIFFGDIYSNTAAGSELHLGDSTIQGHAEAMYTVVTGDIYENTPNSHVYGGNDDMRVSAYVVTGDSFTGQSKSYLTGGNDTISLLENTLDTSYHVMGDVNYTRATVYGGDDVITGYRAQEGVGYFYGDVRIVTGSGAGYGGDDVIKATNSNDFIYGDFLSVSGAVKAVCGDDRLLGYGGDDVMYGDTSSTKAGVVTLWGNDVMRGGGGNDTMYGDVQAEQAGYEAPGGNDRMFGGGGGDTMFGQYGNDLMKGGNGHDNMDGGAGEDKLRGGKGNDIIDGGEGADDLAGGRGADTFVFHSLDGDTVKGFSKAQGDHIDLSNIAEITGYGDLVANHLVDTPGTGSFAISLGGDSYMTVYGVDFDEVTSDMFIF